MAEHKTGSRNKRLSRHKDLLSRRTLCVVIAPATVLLLVISFFCIKGFVDANNALAGMRNYLENKYKQGFTVERPVCRGGAFGVPCVWSADVRALNGGVGFRISRVDGREGYSDNYVVSIWQKEQTIKIQPKAREIFGSVPVSVEIDLGIIDPSIERTFTVHSPTFDEVFLEEDKTKQRGGNLVYGIDFIHSGDIDDIDKFTKDINTFLEYIKSLGVSSKDITINIYITNGNVRTANGYCNGKDLLTIDNLKECVVRAKNTPVKNVGM